MINKIKNWLCRQLFPSVDPNQVITWEKNQYGMKEIQLNGKPITTAEVKSLQEEIKFLKKTRIWNIIHETIGEQARQVMFERSTTYQDMLTGKMMLYNLKLQKDIMKILEEIRVK